MFVTEMQANRGGLVDHDVPVDQSWNGAIGIQCKIVSGLLISFGDVDENELERNANLLEQYVRRHAGGVRRVIQFVHFITESPSDERRWG